jgi:hypothetical protein
MTRLMPGRLMLVYVHPQIQRLCKGVSVGMGVGGRCKVEDTMELVRSGKNNSYMYVFINRIIKSHCLDVGYMDYL